MAKLMAKKKHFCVLENKTEQNLILLRKETEMEK